MANEQRETIEVCKKKIIEPFYDFPNPTSIELKDTDVRAIETVLNMLKEKDAEIEEKDKQIDLMANYIVNLIKYNNPEEIREVEEIKQYFERKAENE